jgi:deazaflavin-dependent oxidoreductase (nitroreductase family)
MDACSCGLNEDPDQTLKRSEAEMAQNDFTRWLYRGQRPHRLARILNRVEAIIASSGIAPDYLVTLEVTGRKSGRTVSLPLMVAVFEGQRYLVSMLGENANWVRNVRATGGKAVLRRGGREEVYLEEVPATQRAPILKVYLQRAPGARPHVPVNKDAPIAEFEKIAVAFPAFRVVKAVHANSRA